MPARNILMAKNNWYVLTGGPCSGKTATLKALKKKGYKTFDEAARIFIDQEIKKGNPLAKIRKDELLFQKKVLRMKVKIEKTLPKDEILFLERGIPDSLAYYKICGVTKNKELEKAAKKSSYKKVFLLELLDYEKDYARTEDQNTAFKLEKELEESYKKIGIPLVRVPKMSIGKRVGYILKNL
jgi:predicted ATPase